MNWTIWPIDGILAGTTILSMSGPGSNTKKAVTPQSSEFWNQSLTTWCSLVSYPRYPFFWGGGPFCWWYSWCLLSFANRGLICMKFWIESLIPWKKLVLVLWFLLYLILSIQPHLFLLYDITPLIYWTAILMYCLTQGLNSWILGT